MKFGFKLSELTLSNFSLSNLRKNEEKKGRRQTRTALENLIRILVHNAESFNLAWTDRTLTIVKG